MFPLFVILVPPPTQICSSSYLFPGLWLPEYALFAMVYTGIAEVTD